MKSDVALVVDRMLQGISSHSLQQAYEEVLVLAMFLKTQIRAEEVNRQLPLALGDFM